MKRPLIWSLCASDSRGGAGLQAVLGQAALTGCECRSIVVAATAQSADGVHAVAVMSMDVIRSQWSAALADGRPDAVVLGWLPPDPDLIRWLAEVLSWLGAPVIWDPVLQASGSGFPQALEELKTLIACATVITPTLDEARWLCGDLHVDAWQAGRQLQALGAHTVVVSGGDSDGFSEWVTDRVVSRVHPEQPETAVLPEFALHQRRLRQRAHGTGSHQAAAIAVALARGERLYDALLTGAVAARCALAAATPSNQGYGNCIAVALPESGSDWPLVTGPDEYPQASEPVAVPLRNGRLSIGLYALTDNIEHLRSLLAVDVDAVQWRVKDQRADLREQTQQALNLCRSAGIPFWLNDDWRLALELGADGVHLGQEDLSDADLAALRGHRIAVGTSNHTQWEIARSRALAPSYLAFGPVFYPLSKTLKYPPLGCEQLALWSSRYRCWPQTCIGGIVPENARAVAAAGTGSLAIVTCLQPGPDQAVIAQSLKKALEIAGHNPISESE